MVAYHYGLFRLEVLAVLHKVALCVKIDWVLFGNKTAQRDAEKSASDGDYFERHAYHQRRGDER